MYVPLDRESTEPLPRQIALYFEELIRRGHVAPGARLPSLRTLARSLGVARETVEIAYDDLSARGLVHVVPGRGAVVRRTIPLQVEIPLPFPETRARDPLPPEAWREPATDSERGLAAVFDFRGERPAPLVVPTASLRAFLRQALEARGPLAGPPPAGGELALREAASRVLAAAGVLRPPDEIAILSGIDEAVRGIVHLFVPRRGVVLADALLEPAAARAVRDAGARLEILDEDDGELPLRRAHKLHPRLLVVPSRHGGIPRSAASAARRRALLDFARDEGIPVLEDLTRSAASMQSDAPPLAVLDRSGRVASLFDFSGEMGGGFEACAIAATPKVLERLRASGGRRGHVLDRIAERALAQALDSPARARLHRRIHESRALLASSLARGIRRRLGALRGVTFSEGARFVKLELPEGISAPALAERARARGVSLLIPADCGAAAIEDGFVLLDLSRHEEGELLEGIRLLGEALDDAASTTPITAHSPEREAAPS